MLSLRMAGACLFLGLLFMYALDAYLPALLFYVIGAWWSLVALRQIDQMEAEEGEK